MATNVVKGPILRAVTKRSYSAKPAQQHASRPADVKTTVLPNKLVIAAVDSPLPISRVSVVFRAGSRHETPENYGATNILRLSAGLTTKDSTCFGITRNLQQIGANLTCRSDRETVAYSLESSAECLEVGLKFLGDVAAKQIFKPWELSDNIPRIRNEIATVPVHAKLLDLLHKAAYRTGLGNCVYCPEYLIGSHSSETLQHYVKMLFTTNRAAVVGVGVDMDMLTCFAQNLSLESGAGPADIPSKFFGGDQRLDTSGDTAHVAIAVEGGSMQNVKEALSYAVLQYAMGIGPCIKWGIGASPLVKAVSSTADNDPFAVTAMNASYTDSGLFGVVASSTSANIGKVVKGVTTLLHTGTVAAADITRAKAQLKAALHYCEESGSGLLEEIGTQAVLLGTVHNAAALSAQVDRISDADIKQVAGQVAKKLKAKQVAVAAVGNIANVPYSTDL